MKCVVTGATGHIGNVLVRQLLKNGYDVTAFVNSEKEIYILDGLNVKIVYGDIRNLDSLHNAFRGSDLVFHLAGIIEIGSGNKKLVYDVNVNGCKNVVQACKDEHVKKLIYTSSVHATPEHEKDVVIHESNIFNPKLVKGLYAKSKAEATNYILNSANENLQVIVVQPSGVIGPFEYIESNLGQLVKDCMNGKMLAYIDGAYNFVDVRDVANGIILASQKGKSKECYFLGGNVVTVRELMLYIQDITGVKAPKTKLPRWFAFATGFLSELYYKIVKQKPLFTSYAVYTLGTNSNFSIDKAKTELGYSVRDVKDTLKDTVDWINSKLK